MEKTGVISILQQTGKILAKYWQKVTAKHTGTEERANLAPHAHSAMCTKVPHEKCISSHSD